MQERNIMFSSEKAIEPVFGASQCQICGVALSGPVSFIFRLAGIRRSPRNPNVCSRCNSHIENGNISEITVLFADLSSFTELTQRLGPEKTHEVVDAFLKMATEILKRQGATIDKYMGDAVMAWFNVPVPQIDHAKRAVQSAIEMQACMPLLEKEYGVKLQISVGISSGWAFVGPVGSKGYSDFTAIGDSVNLAARLEQQAKPGEIILSESVYMGAKEILQNVWQETLNLKGFPDPICVYRIKKNAVVGAETKSLPGSRDSQGIASIGGIVFSILGAPCAVASLISPIALYLGIGWLSGMLGIFDWIDGKPWLRLPFLFLATLIASANLYTIRLARKTRLKRGEKFGMTMLEKKQAFWLKIVSYATLVFVTAELILHPIYNHSFW